jgi:hypothetical protein
VTSSTTQGSARRFVSILAQRKSSCRTTSCEASLRWTGSPPDRIAQRVEPAYARGELPRRDGVTFAYMWSANQHLGPAISHWHPHMMVFSPYYRNEILGNNAFGQPLLVVTDDGGTPFAVVVIPVEDKLAIKVALREKGSK